MNGDNKRIPVLHGADVANAEQSVHTGCAVRVVADSLRHYRRTTIFLADEKFFVSIMQK